MRGGAGYQPERILGVTKNVRSPSSGTLRKLQAHDPQGKFARDLVASAAIRRPPPPVPPVTSCFLQAEEGLPLLL